MDKNACITENLLDWYDLNRRVLPWRVNRTPYGTWISEIMLQQTRVAAVIPYYANFLKIFPDISFLLQQVKNKKTGNNVTAAISGLFICNSIVLLRHCI